MIPPKTPSPALLTLRRVHKSFSTPTGRLSVLDGVDLEIKPGQVVAVIGSSGCGKSTLLHSAGLLEQVDQGEIWLNFDHYGAVAGHSANEKARAAVRRAGIGFVYQHHFLLSEFSALENVMIPQLIAGKTRQRARVHSEELLERVGLAERRHHRPARLSGGEQQRVALARALANGPRLLLADEPTGNLDPKNAQEVMALIDKLVAEQGLAAFITTHNQSLAARADRCLRLCEGRLVPALDLAAVLP